MYQNTDDVIDFINFQCAYGQSIQAVLFICNTNVGIGMLLYTRKLQRKISNTFDRIPPYSMIAQYPPYTMIENVDSRATHVVLDYAKRIFKSVSCNENFEVFVKIFYYMQQKIPTSKADNFANEHPQPLKLGKIWSKNFLCTGSQRLPNPIKIRA